MQFSSGATDLNPAVIQLNDEISYTKKSIIESINNQLVASRQYIAELNRRLRNVESELKLLPKTERELINIERKFELNEGMYVFLKQRQAELGIAKSSYVPSAKVVDYAKLDFQHIYPKETNNYGIGGFLGLLVPLLIVVVVDVLDNKIKSKQDLDKATKIPLAGIIGHNDKSTNLSVFANPKSSIAESFRALRSNLGFFSPEEENSGKIFVVTSSISGEGKTFCSINLASVLSLSGKPTVLVGVDLRKPKIYMDFDLSNQVGLSNFLVGQADKEDIIQPTKYPNLSLISAGPIPPNPSELILSEYPAASVGIYISILL
jgi:capsular polysaccharide biosynthesis protein